MHTIHLTATEWDIWTWKWAQYDIVKPIQIQSANAWHHQPSIPINDFVNSKSLAFDILSIGFD